MANLSIRRDAPSSSTAQDPSLPTAFDPFQVMRDLFRWEPFGDLARNPPGERMTAFTPQFDVKETAEAFVFRADVPGVQEKDLEVSVANNRLVISGKREAEHEDRGDSYYKRERSWGAFTRSFTLPNSVDPSRSGAELRNGVLVVTLPKVDMSQPKKISIKASEKPQTEKTEKDKQSQPNQS